jgi:ferric-chelate reductase
MADDPNGPIKNERDVDYPKQTWYLLASFIGLLVIFHIGSTIVRWIRKRRILSAVQYVEERKEDSTNEEPARSSSNSGTSLRRIPIALVNTFRIVAFRIPLRIGGGSVVNVAEIGVAAGYIIAIFIWEFINCVTPHLRLSLSPF